MSEAPSRSVRVVSELASYARPLRATFDERFADPRSTRGDRFQWDYWHVPDQYTALRTPAWTYFPPAAYRRFHQALVQWGRRVLGCHDVSPPWLSLYVDGCGQRLHGDLPHGPWAFVYSLTDWQARQFVGGETLMLRDQVLDYWSTFAGGMAERSVEEPDVVRAIEPTFGRLTVFDPRIPHGVRTVRGTQDPRHGRLVINGWFVQPRPFISGPLSTKSLAARLDDLGSVIEGAGIDVPVTGLVSFGFDVAADGATSKVRVLSDTTRVPAADEAVRLRLVRALAKAVRSWNFGKQRGASTVTLPIVFS